MSTHTVRRLPTLLTLVVILALALTRAEAPLAAQHLPPPESVRPSYEDSAVPFGEAVEWAPSPATSLTDAEVDDPEEASIAAVLVTARQVTAGQEHTCAVTFAGGVKCWGWNEFGQLGDGTTATRSTPVDVIGLGSGVVAVAAGAWHTCALTASGGVKCWGNNGNGQLGDGTLTDRSVPVGVAGLSSEVTALTAGSWHNCVLSAGGAKCWGWNDYGQLGDGTTVQRRTPVAVIGMAYGVASLEAGGWHSCALTASGGIKCWGYNSNGQLGDGTTTHRSVPVTVIGLSSGATAFAAGHGHTCAVVTGSGVKCWGTNYRGQLGDGTTITRLTPVIVGGLASGVTTLTGGTQHTCAVGANGDVKCWGLNDRGQLGDGTTIDRLSPVDVIGLATDVTAITSSYDHTCALISSGGIKCWGDNNFGQVGDGSAVWRPSPVGVVGLASGVTALDGRWNHVCGLTAIGGVKCWGDNNSGQLGDSTTERRSLPVDVVGLASGFTSITAGPYHSCATNMSGAKCWGNNLKGQLGDGTTGFRHTPVDVVGLSSGVTAAVAGYDHTCALMANGGVKCWGANDRGQLGDNSTVGKNYPVDVVGLTSGVRALAAGSYHTCAVTASGGVKCWGSNQYGQLGDGTNVNRLAPAAVFGLSSGTMALAGGFGHSCASIAGGGVKCWGYNNNGQLGDGTTTNRSMPTTVVGLGSDVIALGAGFSHTCAMTSGGGMCWGRNNWGQLGDGTNLSRTIPVAVAGLTSGVTTLAAGYSHTCALTSGGDVRCWGANTEGQLGDGRPLWRATPVDVVGFGPTYTISGRVTDASGNGIPGVTVWAGTARNTTTDANGDYTFTGLSTGTYIIRPEKAPYAFSPALRMVTVPPNATGVDFQAVSITKIQVNQVLGNTTNYVAGKDTAVRVFMSDAVPFDPDHQQLQIYRNGNLITQTPLKPRKFNGRSNVLDFLCDRQECDAWQEGFYTFEARVNGDYLSQPSVEFKERRKLKVRIVPVRIGSLTPTSDGLANVPDLARQLFPMGRDDLEIVTERELDATAITFNADTGYDPLYPKLRERHPLWWRWLCQPLPSAWLLPNCYSDIVVGVLPDVDLWPESWRTPGQTRYESLTSIVRELKNMGWTQQVFAHEAGHLVGYDKGTHSGLGDEYDGYCGVFQCSNNPPPNTFVGRDGIDAACMTVPTCPTQNAPNWVYEDGMGSMVDGTGPDQDYPFNVMASRALTDSLSFMGKGAEKDSRYWVTPRAYNYMFGALARGVIIASAPGAEERVALVEGWIDSNDSVSLAPIYHMTTISPPAGTGSYAVEVLDAAQAVLAQQQFEVSFLVLSNPPREATSAPFAAAVRLPAGAKAVRVMHNDLMLTQVSVTSHTPTLSLTSPTIGQTWAATGNYTIRWQGNDLDGDTLYYTVLYRQGAGDWIVLGGDLTTSELTVDAARLPGGTAAQVQVLATDGINTTVAESGLFTVGRKGPEAFITHPADGASFMPGVSFFLQGTAYDLEDGALPDSAYRWTSNRDGDLGTGATNLVILSPGPHVITLAVTDSDGNRATAIVRLWAGSEQFMPLILRGR